MQTIRGIFLTGVAAGAMAFGSAGETEAASMTTELWGAVGLAIDSQGSATQPNPYSVFSASDPDLTNLPNYSLLGGFGAQKEANAGSNQFSVTTTPGFSGGLVAPLWRLDARIEGMLYFTDRTGQEQPVRAPTSFSLGSTLDYGPGLSAQDLADTAALAQDVASVFWQATATLFNTNVSGATGLTQSVFSQITATNPSALWGNLINDDLDWSFAPDPDLTLDGGGFVSGGGGTFEFDLTGQDGVTSINSLWAALGLGSFGDFTNPNDVPTTITYHASVTLTAIPLPAGLPLMLGALGVLGVAGWKRRNARAA